MSGPAMAGNPPGVVAVRFYFHRDAKEQDPAAFYCARCDAFVPRAHFEPGACPANPMGSTDADRIGAGRRTLRKSQRRFARGLTRMRMYRPDNAPTLPAGSGND